MAIATTADAVPDLFRDAWDAGDAEAFGSLFTADASYVIVLGDVLLGRDEIQRAHRDVFKKWQAGTKMRIRTLRVTELSADVVVLLTVGGIGRAEIEIDKFQTFTVVRRSDRWLVAAYQNTEMSPRGKKQYASV